MTSLKFTIASGNTDEARRVLNALKELGELVRYQCDNRLHTIRYMSEIVFESRGADIEGEILVRPCAPEAATPAPRPNSVTLIKGEPGAPGVTPRCAEYQERYASLAGVSNVVLVRWDDDRLHEFSRDDGRCLGSPGGVMRGWRVHPADLKRFGVEPAKAIADRFVRTIEVVEIRVQRTADMNGKPLWCASVDAGSDYYAKQFAHDPTDAEVLADYEAWKDGRS